MQPRILLVVVVALLIGCNTTTAIPQEFSGHFVSDRETTIARWKETQPWGDKTPLVIEKLGSILGSTEVLTDGGSYTVIAGDWTEKGKTN